jgi:hypothetical protein
VCVGGGGSCRVAQAVSSAFTVAEGGCGVHKSIRGGDRQLEARRGARCQKRDGARRFTSFYLGWFAGPQRSRTAATIAAKHGFKAKGGHWKGYSRQLGATYKYHCCNFTQEALMKKKKKKKYMLPILLEVLGYIQGKYIEKYSRKYNPNV